MKKIILAILLLFLCKRSTFSDTFADDGYVVILRKIPPKHNTHCDVLGEIALDLNYIYVCMPDKNSNANNWGRALLLRNF